MVWICDISIKTEYGISKLNRELIETLCKIIENDLKQNIANSPTETNWYFYGSTVVKDAIGDHIRPTIMVQERNAKFLTNFNISDHDFAVNLDTILSFKRDFENCLVQL